MPTLSSPAHGAAIRFLRGGLVAVIALLVPPRLGALSRAWPAVAPLVAAASVAIPAMGFAIGGAIGATALDRGRRGVIAFGAGLCVTGAVLAFTAPLFQGLTGFEDAWTVGLTAAASTAVAFASGGAVAALVVQPRLAGVLAAGFGAGGATGGLLTVVPALFAAATAGWPGDAQLFVRVACSLAGLLAPFAIGGAVAGWALDEAREGER